MKILYANEQTSIMDIEPQVLADQITLMDLVIFKSISKEELISLQTRGPHYTKKNNLSPNIIALDKQFNQISFLVVGQVLSRESARVRADVISHVIRIADKLHQLNNLHSSSAVVLALLSSPIYRLEKTWHFVRKKYPKEKMQFDHLRRLYSDENNYELLRNHLNNCQLPCIPYLGLFYRDMTYIFEAHRQGNLKHLAPSTAKILDTIGKFQTSQYDDTKSVPDVNRRIMSNFYIDEFQKLVEDENYRRSLELEPPAPPPSPSLQATSGPLR